MDYGSPTPDLSDLDPTDTDMGDWVEIVLDAD